MNGVITHAEWVIATLVSALAAYFGYLAVKKQIPRRRRAPVPPPPQPQGISDVFLCYAEDDEDWAEKLGRALVAEGVSVWLLKWELLPGDVTLRRLEDGLRKSRIPAPVFSPRSIARKEFLDQYAAGLDQVRGSSERLIPIVIDGAERPPFAAIREPADFTGLRGQAYTALVSRLARAARQSPDPAA